MGKYTPGPWAYEEPYPCIRSIHRKGISVTHVIYATNMNYDDERRARADADLILAAPDMYEALKRISDDAGAKGGLTWELYELARKAVAKARG